MLYIFLIYYSIVLLLFALNTSNRIIIPIRAKLLSALLILFAVGLGGMFFRNGNMLSAVLCIPLAVFGAYLFYTQTKLPKGKFVTLAPKGYRITHTKKLSAMNSRLIEKLNEIGTQKIIFAGQEMLLNGKVEDNSSELTIYVQQTNAGNNTATVVTGNNTWLEKYEIAVLLLDLIAPAFWLIAGTNEKIQAVFTFYPFFITLNYFSIRRSASASGRFSRFFFWCSVVVAVVLWLTFAIVFPAIWS